MLLDDLQHPVAGHSAMMAHSCRHVLNKPQNVRGSAVAYAGEDHSPHQPILFHRFANFRYCDFPLPSIEGVTAFVLPRYGVDQPGFPRGVPCVAHCGERNGCGFEFKSALCGELEGVTDGVKEFGERD